IYNMSSLSNSSSTTTTMTMTTFVDEADDNYNYEGDADGLIPLKDHDEEQEDIMDNISENSDNDGGGGHGEGGGGGGGGIGLEEIDIRDVNSTSDDGFNKPSTPLPKLKIFSIFIVILCDAINAQSIYPYVNFLVEDFHLTSNDKTLGYYVGFLASSYYSSQLFSSFFWGWFSNYKGRRPSVICGLLGSMMCMFFFGFSRSYGMAITFRFLAGLLNGNIAVAKTMLGEITDSSNQARAFSFIGLSWSIGGICAPLIGGMASNVCKQYPTHISSPSNLLCKFPYLLPNLICIFFSIIGFLLTFFYLSESKTFTLKSAAPGKRPTTPKTLIMSLLQKIKNLSSQTKRRFQLLATSVNRGGDSNNNVETDYNGGGQEGESDATGIVLVSMKTIDVVADDNVDLVSNQIVIEQDEVDADNGDDANSDQPRSVKQLLKDREVMMSCIFYAVIGFHFTIFEEGFGVWSPITRTIDPITGLPTGGGYGFTSRDIGILQSTAGIFALFIQSFVFPPLVNRIGLVKSYRLAFFMVLPAWIFLPELSRFTITQPGQPVPHPPLFWVLLFPVYLCQSFGSEFGYISIIVMISNSALPKDMAIVNSIGMFLVSISRTVGPIIGSSLMALTVSHNMPYPFDYHFFFVMLTLFAVVLIVSSFFLSPSLNHPKMPPRNANNKIKTEQQSQVV
ncbi:hypothetical protein SAMD00019534_104330, partial [Acytostelium subglobosum LB1]|uniref:hypothetical protein n=1 Tax=Acytostelium subglobosum LB1 TaxID=1410327 RepID=UPI0006451B81